MKQVKPLESFEPFTHWSVCQIIFEYSLSGYFAEEYLEEFLCLSLRSTWETVGNRAKVAGDTFQWIQEVTRYNDHSSSASRRFWELSLPHQLHTRHRCREWTTKDAFPSNCAGDRPLEDWEMQIFPRPRPPSWAMFFSSDRPGSPPVPTPNEAAETYFIRSSYHADFDKPDLLGTYTNK